MICERPPYEAARGNVEFSNCVRVLARGVNGRITPRQAAMRGCSQTDFPRQSPEFGQCVAETRDLVRG